jgi:hypothetical protein
MFEVTVRVGTKFVQMGALAEEGDIMCLHMSSINFGYYSSENILCLLIPARIPYEQDVLLTF